MSQTNRRGEVKTTTIRVVTRELTEPGIGLSMPDTPETIQRRQKLYEIMQSENRKRREGRK